VDVSLPDAGGESDREYVRVEPSSARETVMGKSETTDQDASVRLELFLSSSGIGARRKCAEFIRAGRVSVDGQVVDEPGFRIQEATQVVRFDGEQVRYEVKRYFVVNKPTGYICTHRDPAGRPRAVDLVPLRSKTRLFTVGRLDESSQGLLLVTNDGFLANRLAHPRYEVTRTYRVQVAGIPDGTTLMKLRRGMYFADGKLQVRAARKLRTQGKSSYLELDMREGRNREIRRLLSRVGHKVIKLERIAFGPLRLARLGLGCARELKADEVERLRKFVAGSRKSQSRGAAKSADQQAKSSRSNKRRRNAAAPPARADRGAKRSKRRVTR
jgi:23S rRNA pseudouridine2605 synthase